MPQRHRKEEGWDRCGTLETSEIKKGLSSLHAQVITVLFKHSRSWASAYLSFSRAQVDDSAYYPMTCSDLVGHGNLLDDQ